MGKDSNGRNSILRGWLNLLVVIYILFLIVGWGYYLMTLEKGLDMALEISLCSVMCMLNFVGIVYLSRNLKLGLYILLIAPALMALLFIGLTGAVSLPMCISFALAVMTLIPLFLKKKGRSSWSQMKDGMDLAHFKHIYQLSTFLILLSAGYGGYAYYTMADKKTDTEYPFPDAGEALSDSEVQKSLKALDRTTITLGQISEIEKVIMNIPPEYEVRIMALRHILAGHITADEHDVESFKIAYTLRKGALSEEQQHVLDWFFRQNKSVMELWESSGSSASLAVFQNRLKKLIKERKMTEL